ncbi:Hsp20/alpha crystallin family protein [Seonamhaeicola algicola]|uniref:Hsp20/alpha crystallin family protein n=1 Tax=Seonamhaeicola algicola TaxID=1719036 RepID=A0A5C7B5C0_9FLAO|nr:Hsp20/alpha crystallin family protein [Seonamhaeicola algicola]TXE14999.1 Hsp20/alpha crystallin family protein [Seonamhaeicola algicola]
MSPASSLTIQKPQKRKSSITTNNTKPQTKNPLNVLETDFGFQYKLKIPGYIKDDFRFYVTKNDLVVTTQKEALKTAHTTNKHTYCYPSALFKMNIPLPKKAIKNEISVDYKNETLSFNLYKKSGS